MSFKLIYLIALTIVLSLIIVLKLKIKFQNIYHIDYKKHFSYIYCNNKFIILENGVSFNNNVRKIYMYFFSKYCFIEFENFILVINKFTSKSMIFKSQTDMNKKLLKIYNKYKKRENIWHKNY